MQNTGIINLEFLIESMDNKNEFIRETIDVILDEIPEDIKRVQEAVNKENYAAIRSSAHRMKSTIGLIGSGRIRTLLDEMERFGLEQREMDKIKHHNIELNSACITAMHELKDQRNKFI